MGFLTKIVSILKRSSKEGQHTIEYAVLMILVMAGIITMGRYVIRSWNASLKGYEDSAIDSMEDPLLTVPPPPVTTSCIPGGWSPLGCGLGLTNVCTGSTPACSEFEMTSIQSYNPPGCQCASCAGDSCVIQCNPDPCCCEAPVPTGCRTTPGDAVPPACGNVGLSPANPGGGCPNGFMGFSTRCGGSTYYGCAIDPACLVFCPAGTYSVGPGGITGFFPQTIEGQPGVSVCPPIGYTGGPPTMDCLTGGVWGSLQNPCVLACGDGFCNELIGETCNTCTADCGFPSPYAVYGACPNVCPNNVCEAGEDCCNCASDCTSGTCTSTIDPYGFPIFTCS